MGSSTSKIDYENIDTIADKTTKNLKKPYQHTITFQNKKIKPKIYNFTKGEEEDFQLRYKCMKFYEKVRKIDYYNIEHIRYKTIKDDKKNENIHILTLLFYKGTIDTIQLNQQQYDFFIMTYKKLNKNPILPTI